MAQERQPWKRSRRGRWVAGVCRGLAQSWGWNVAVVRAVWLVCTLIPVLPGLPAYLALWFVLPVEGEDSEVPVDVTPDHGLPPLRVAVSRLQAATTPFSDRTRPVTGLSYPIG